MESDDWLAERFQQHRPRLRAVAYRMLGTLVEADDAVQDAWLRLSSSETERIDNLGGWLTTVVARECLHRLRSRRRRREYPLAVGLSDPIITDEDIDPEQEALLADSVGLALLVVLDHLTPAERLAYVLHDMFDVPFEEIASMLGRSEAAARQLASRARRRVKQARAAVPGRDLARQREVVDAFFAAARHGDFDALVQVLDPDVVLRIDFGAGRRPGVYQGVRAVAKFARAPRGAQLHPVLVNGTIGTVVTIDGHPISLMAFTVARGRILQINGIRDPDRVSRITSHTLRMPSAPRRRGVPTTFNHRTQ
jgi:RNA polymerase sigma-70 factor (ECF subfamily)